MDAFAKLALLPWEPAKGMRSSAGPDDLTQPGPADIATQGMPPTLPPFKSVGDPITPPSKAALAEALSVCRTGMTQGQPAITANILTPAQCVELHKMPSLGQHKHRTQLPILAKPSADIPSRPNGRDSVSSDCGTVCWRRLATDTVCRLAAESHRQRPHSKILTSPQLPQRNKYTCLARQVL